MVAELMQLMTEKIIHQDREQKITGKNGLLEAINELFY